MEICSINLQDKLQVSPGDIRGSVDVLKEGRMFMNSLPGGEIPCHDLGGLGLYFADTRFLSCLEISLNDTVPVFLSRTLRDSHFSQVEMTNKQFISDGQVIPLHSVHIRLLRMVKDALYQRIRVVNFYSCALEVTLRIRLGADFADIFEVRGTPRTAEGKWLGPVIRRHKANINYLGADNVSRSAEISFSPAPAAISKEDYFIIAEYRLKLLPKEKNYIYLKITPLVGDRPAVSENLRKDLGFRKAAEYLIESYQRWKDQCLKITSDNEHFNTALKVAVTDLRALSTTYPEVGTVLEAGIPWYAAPFGRDSLIAAWQSLIVNPGLAKETLRFLARYQGKEENSWQDEEPGKILHEMRFGEMARSGELPHTPYYGSVDSTLWFIILLADYINWTGDINFFGEMAQPLAQALMWCENYGDMDDDGYIEYRCRSEKGLFNQGWKDSWDALVDKKGIIPESPFALVEVQAYYYKAMLDAAGIYEQVGQTAAAEGLRKKAEKLRENFNQDFWSVKNGFPVFALDGKKKPLTTIVSNPGHCLFTGILPAERAMRVVDRLMKPDLFSGWGIRTMSADEVPFNPMSYHNGSVWPHDNSIIGFGMRRSGKMNELKLVTDTLFEASRYFYHGRLPELFCGFTKANGVGPVKYPIACDPQAWSVGAVFLFLRAMLGIECRGSELYVRDPMLPGFLQSLSLENIRTGSGKVSLEFTKRQDKTYCSVTENEGDVKIIFEKGV
ncbi:MAG: amylo-alpha-1,6-glucosidase [Firmicutes bacterium HGW-Firmicutes-14]|nr:MAG: amylo-alpha-1,6-glucosidase [Firmicutes bacterium HGW-Firmicutes-14]